MRTTVFCIVIAAVLAFSTPVVRAESTIRLHKQVAELKEQVEMLEAAIAKQAETIKEYQEFKKEFALLLDKSEDQAAEIQRLRGLCKQKGINPNVPTDGNPANYCIYKGKERDKKWFDKYWMLCGKQYVKVNGKVKFRKEILTELNYIHAVADVLGGGNYLLTNQGKTIYVSGLPGGYVDGDKFIPGVLKNAGTYSYTTVLGGSATVKRYEKAGHDIQPLTPFDFAESLKSGQIELIKTRKARGKVVVMPVP